MGSLRRIFERLRALSETPPERIGGMGRHLAARKIPFGAVRMTSISGAKVCACAKFTERVILSLCSPV
jgi:hypothetical protein